VLWWFRDFAFSRFRVPQFRMGAGNGNGAGKTNRRRTEDELKKSNRAIVVRRACRSSAG